MLSGRTFGLRRPSTARAVAVPVPAPDTPLGAAPLAMAKQPGGGGGWRSHTGSLLFILPAAIFLGAIVVYPLVATLVRSLFDNNNGSSFVGLGNYKEIFATDDILIGLRNNVIWVIVFPFTVTFLGLVFAVLTERIRWAVAFKTVVFLPPQP